LALAGSRREDAGKKRSAAGHRWGRRGARPVVVGDEEGRDRSSSGKKRGGGSREKKRGSGCRHRRLHLARVSARGIEE
jgi:hypothetical protein